jgi:hypothetical protein
MKKFINSKYFPTALYTVVSIILLWPVMKSTGLPFKYDWNWPLFDLNSFSKQLFDFTNLSIVSVFSKYSDLFLSIFGLVFRNPLFGLKIYLLLITVAAAYGFHLFIKSKIDNKALAMIAPIFYAFTPYLFIRIIVGFQTSQIAYAALPFFYYFYFRKEKCNTKEMLFATIPLLFVFAQSQAGFLVSLTIFISLLVSIIYKTFGNELKKVGTLVGWFLLFNLPWLIVLATRKASITVSSGGSVTTLNSIGNLPHSLRNVLMLSDHHITRDFFYALAREKSIIIGFCLILLAALISIFNKRLRRYFLIFAISALIILPFTIGPTGKFTSIFTWTYNHFPVLALFRETYHFEFLLSFALITLFGIGADFLIKRFSVKYFRSEAIFIGLGLFIIAPFLTFDFAGYLPLTKLSAAYGDFNNYVRTNNDFCQKAYYPPNMGFVYFKNDSSRDAVNSDLLAKFTDIPHISEGSSVLNVASDEMFERNILTSIYLNRQDNGEFATVFDNIGLDCVVVRRSLDTKYDQVSNLWQEPDREIRGKWLQSDMLSLMETKIGFSMEKSFEDEIFVYKRTSEKFSNPAYLQLLYGKVGDEASSKFQGSKYIALDLPGAANRFDYYKDGWSRGRYAFWRKEMFAALMQDFIYTDTSSSLTMNTDLSGRYSLFIRYLNGGSSGKMEINVSGKQFEITKSYGEEKFAWKELGDMVLDKSPFEIKNISGENAIADLVLVKY